LAASAAIVASFAAVIPASAQAGTSKLRIAHFSPDAPAIDVYFDGVKRLTNVQYEKHSNYLDLPSGKHKIEVRATGNAATVPAVVAADIDLAPNSAYTLAAIGKLAEIKGQLYTDDTSAPDAGKVKLRVLHTAPEVGPVDVAVKGGQELAAKLAYPDASPYITLDPGKYDVEVRATGSTTAVLASTVVLQEGGVYTVAAIGGGDKKPKLKGLIDLQPSGVAAVTTAAGVTTAGDTPTSVAATSATVAVAAQDTAVTTEAGVETTVPAETTPATEPAPTTEVEAAPTTEAEAAPTTDAAPPETDPAPSTTLDVPKSGVASGAGGLAGGGAIGATALAALAGAAVLAAARKRRAA
jgi:Domain of unknown function (DUF4397)